MFGAYHDSMRAWIEKHQVLAVALGAGLGYAVWTFRAVVIVLFVGYVLAAAMRPAVDWFDRFMPRALAILLAYVLIFGALFGVLIPMGFTVAGQSGTFSAQLSADIEKLGAGTYLQSAGLSVRGASSYIVHNAVTITTSALSGIAAGVTAIIISVYLLYEWHELHDRARAGASAGSAGAVWRESDRMLGAWVRGQLALSAVVGVLVFLALIIIGVPFAPVLGVWAAFAEFIPYVGPIIAAAPAVLLAFNASLTKVIVVIAAYTLIQQLENHFLVPIIMRRSVDLHPVIVIASMLFGFELLGIIGIVIAVPVAALIRTLIVRFAYA